MRATKFNEETVVNEYVAAFPLVTKKQVLDAYRMYPDDFPRIRARLKRIQYRKSGISRNGKEGYKKLKDLIPTENLMIKELFPDVDFKVFRSSNIYQYSNEKFVSKAVDAVQYDFNSAYAYHAKMEVPIAMIDRLEKLPEWFNNKEHIALFVGEYRIQFNLPVPKAKEVLIFQKGWLDGSKIQEIRDASKSVFNAGIGELSNHHILGLYIWNQQGQMMKNIHYKMEQKKFKVYKIHTDSIAFDPKGLEYFKTITDITNWKREYEGKLKYLHASCYRYDNSSKIKGISNCIRKNNCLIYKKNGLVSLDSFDCLIKDDKVLCRETNRKTRVTRLVWKSLNQLGEESYKA